MNAKYRIDTGENKAFLQEMTNAILAFGHQFPSPEGGSYYLGDDGTPWKERNIETWITSRMAHVYSIGTFLHHEGSKELAEAAIRGLLGQLHDDVNRGWYAGVDKDGKILPTKQCYAHAFVILAGTSGILADIPGSRELLRDALKVYDDYFWNEEEGLACDIWNTEFTVKDTYRGLNANMHSVEAFLAVADALGMEEYRERCKRVIDHICKWARENNWRLPEHYNDSWQADLNCNIDHPDDPFKPYGATPGHSIEWARLIVQWALSTFEEGDPAIDPYVNAAIRLYRQAVKSGWYADGAPGIVYTTDWSGKPVVHDRMHWTLAEAINTSATLYRVTGREEFAGDFAAFMEYLDDKVYDHKNGSWYHQLDENNCLKETVWPGKSDLYHALQATLIPYCDVKVSVAKAVKEEQSR